MADARTGFDGPTDDTDDGGDDRFVDLLVRTLPEPVGIVDVRTDVERRVARRRRRRVAARAGIAVVAVVTLAGGAAAALRTDDGPAVVAVTDDPSTTVPPATDAAPSTEAVPTTEAVATTAAPTTTAPAGATDDAACRTIAPVAGTAAYVAVYCGGTGMFDDPMTVVALHDAIGTLQERMQASLIVLGASEKLEDVPGRRTAFVAGFLLPAATVTVDDAGAVTVVLAVDLTVVPNATTSNVAGTLNRQLFATFFAYPEASSVTVTGQCIGDVVCPFTQTRAEWDAAEAIRAGGTTITTIPSDPHELEELQQRLEDERQRQAELAAERAAEARETTTTSG
jgi:hypothetical protein